MERGWGDVCSQYGIFGGVEYALYRVSLGERTVTHLMTVSELASRKRGQEKPKPPAAAVAADDSVVAAGCVAVEWASFDECQ